MKRMISFKLYFGRSSDKLGYITNDEFFNFISRSDEILPDGFTITTGQGMWKSKPETTSILEVIVDESETSRVADSLTKIAEAYNQGMCQECTLFTKTAVEAAFITEHPPKVG